MLLNKLVEVTFILLYFLPTLHYLQQMFKNTIRSGKGFQRFFAVSLKIIR